jgi:predicted Fe-Mo cluster-binding NifX family protein
MRGLRLPSVWLVACYAMLTIMVASADEARIAVAAEIGEKDAPVSAMAARSPHILIFNGDGSFVAAYRNPVAENPRRAGPALASWLAGKHVGTFIAGNFRPL